MPHVLLRYELAPDYLERRGSLRDQHLALAWRSADAGELLLGGGVGQPIKSALLLFNDAGAAEAFAGADPYVREGLVRSWQVLPWHTVVGEQATNPMKLEAGDGTFD